MVKKWKKLTDKFTKSGGRSNLATDVENIEKWINLELYDIKPLLWFKDQFRVRLWDYRLIFEKTDNWNKILKIDKRWDVYK